MKICVISSIFFPLNRGGAEAAAYAAALAFAQGGHDVFVITCAPFEGWGSFAGKWEEQLVRTPSHSPSERGRNELLSPPAGGGVRGGGSAIRVFRFTPFNLFSIFSISKRPALLRLFWHVLDMLNLHTYLVVRRVLLQEKPDLILTHNLKGLGYTVHLAIHHSRYIKQFVHQRAHWFHTVHDLGAIHPTGLRIWGREKSIFARNPLTWLYARINKKLLGDPDVVISPSQFLLDEYRTRGFFPKSKTVVVRNPVISQWGPGSAVSQLQGSSSAPPQFWNIRGKIEARAADAPNAAYSHRQNPAATFRFLFLGQLEPYKGLRLLLDVWRDFSAAHKDAELIIAGEGSMKGEVEQTARQLARVHYHGFVPHEKLSELFLHAYFTVIPSLAYENSPTTIGESFAMGVPVIASRIGGIPEIIKDGVDGFLFVPGDREALYDAMERALESNWETLSKQAEKSAEAFSLEQYCKTLMGLCGR